MSAESNAAALLSRPVVAARNALTHADANTVRAVLVAERAGKARKIILDAVASRMRKLGITDAAPIGPTVTCTRDKATTATGDDEIGRLFGWRMMPTKGGEKVRRPQPQCKKCRALPPVHARGTTNQGGS